MKFRACPAFALVLASLTACSKEKTPNPAGLVDTTARINTLSDRFVVFAWGDRGQHMMNPTYDQLILMPPYSTLIVQVIERGNPPQVVTGGVTVEYLILGNTFSYGKRLYGGFWDTAPAVFRVDLPHDIGINAFDQANRHGLSGTMVPVADHFEAAGIPLTPVEDSGNWNPFQMAQVTVKDALGNVVGKTQACLPTSDEINCGKCHGVNAFGDILAKHDARQGTNLVAQQPVLCMSCHGDQFLGYPLQAGIQYLSEAIHTFHATAAPTALCQDCHPGPITQFSRSATHAGPDGNCSYTLCHGDMTTVGTTITAGLRIPWVTEPKCVNCHIGPFEVDTGTALFRETRGHGGMLCPSCHGTAHGLVPSFAERDNYQQLQYQSSAKTIGSCGPCHLGSKGQSPFAKFDDMHGGLAPDNATACNICHTAVSAKNTDLWPHAFQWLDRKQ